MREVEHLLIGGGIASASAAQELAGAGASSVLLVGRELDPPYERPPATKDYLRGVSTRQDALVALPDAVEVLTRASVTALDVESRTAKLSTKEEVRFGTALVATGAMVRRLPLDGSQLDGIHYIRTLPNADSLRADLAGGRRVAVIGGSFIGVEVAASLAELGAPATVVMVEPEPLSLALGEQAGRWVRGLLEAHGVEVLGGVEVEGFEGEQRVAAVVLGGGRRVEAQVAVMGTGVIPDTMLARKAGLQIGESGGIVTDSRMRTSAEGIYAAGDVAEFDSTIHGVRRRIEHFEVAAGQGRVAARNMLGEAAIYDEVPYFWTDIADWATLEYVGAAKEWDEERLDGSTADGAFSIRYLLGGRLVAVLSVGGHADLDAAGAEIRG